jgi:hypothetical protein
MAYTQSTLEAYADMRSALDTQNRIKIHSFMFSTAVVAKSIGAA